MEIRYFRENDVKTITLANGSTIDLTKINLNHLNWENWKY